jgi:hypothetical protein
VQTFLRALGTNLRGSLARLTGSEDGSDSFSRGRPLDSAYQAIVTSPADARYEWGIMHDPHDLEENMRVMQALNILARQVEREAQRQPALQAPQLRELFTCLGRHLDAFARAIGAAIANAEKNFTVSANAFSDLRDNIMQLIDIQQCLTSSQQTRTAVLQLVFNLLLIDRLLTNMARRMNIKLVTR